MSSQSKKNYELKRRETHEVGQAAEKTTAAAKNSDKVQQMGYLTVWQTFALEGLRYTPF